MMSHLLSQDTRGRHHCWSVFTSVILCHWCGWSLLRVGVNWYTSSWVTFFRGV